MIKHVWVLINFNHKLTKTWSLDKDQSASFQARYSTYHFGNVTKNGIQKWQIICIIYSVRTAVHIFVDILTTFRPMYAATFWFWRLKLFWVVAIKHTSHFRLSWRSDSFNEHRKKQISPLKRDESRDRSRSGISLAR